MNIDKEQSHDDNANLFFQDLMASTTNKISCLSSLIKDNIAIIVLIPTVLGGLIQLFKLGTMDLRYIRYFSVTQLVPDGLLAILILSISAFIVYIHVKIFISTIPNVSKKFNKRLSNLRFIIHLLIAIGMTLTVIGASIKINSYISYYDFSKQDIYMCISILGLTYFNIAFILFNIRLIDNKNFLRISSKLKRYIAKLLFIALGSIMLTALLLTAIRMAYLAIEYIHEPKGIYNYSMIKKTIASDFKKYNDYEIIYFNDKYTFVKVYIENSNFTVIYKTDNVFFNPTTIEVK